MSTFYTARPSPMTSPMSRIRSIAPPLDSIDVTTSSAISSVSAALAGLKPKDIELIDEIIERSPRTATTFLTVFKAYNEVLHERGMDASNDVVYYKMLLKLGVVRGKDWGAKWDSVKSQQGYEKRNTLEDSATTLPTQRVPTSAPNRYLKLGNSNLRENEDLDFEGPSLRTRLDRLRQRAGLGLPIASGSGLSVQEKAALPVHRHGFEMSQTSATDSEDAVEDQLELTETETTDQTDDASTITDQTETETDSPTTQARRNIGARNMNGGLGGMRTDPTKLSLPTVDDFLPVRAQRSRSSIVQSSEFSNDQLNRTSTPPPRKSGVASLTAVESQVNSSSIIPKRARAKPELTTTMEVTGIDRTTDEETWAKVKMARDEKEADKFREVMLVERCWNVWSSGLQWLISMHKHVGEEYEKSLLETSFQKWTVRFGNRARRSKLLDVKLDAHILRRVLVRWKARLKHALELKRRGEMRDKLNLLRSRKEEQLIHVSWTIWRKRCQILNAELKTETRSEKCLLSKMWLKWRQSLERLDRKADIADNFSASHDVLQARRLWETWWHKCVLRDLERQSAIAARPHALRPMWQTWRQQLALRNVASAFYDHVIVRHFYQMWKARVSQTKGLEKRADKYMSRQNVITQLAILRVWRTKAIGQCKQRTLSTQLVQSAIMIWRARHARIRKADNHAEQFRTRPSSVLTRSALQRWYQSFAMKQEHQTAAQRYRDVFLVHQTALVWRIRLRVKLKMGKEAKVARRYFLIRRTWIKWKKMMEERRREKKVQALELRITKKFFDKWRTSAVRERNHQLLLKKFLMYREAMLVGEFMSRWFEHTVNLRDRALVLSRQRDLNLLSSSYLRWRDVYKRISDVQGLWQSYNDVRQDALLRRLFTRWHNLAKAGRHKKLSLQEREDDYNLYLMEKAWECWSERFKSRRLQPLEDEFLIQVQRNRLYGAYLIWHSRTKSIPALQFASLHLKAKHWKRWRKCMPEALQAREARKLYSRKLMARAVDKWAEATRTKIALKAIARARYLRLPSGTPRQSLPVSSALRCGLLASPSITTARTTTLAPSAHLDDKSEKGSTVAGDDATSNVGSSITSRRRPLVSRMTKLTTTRPTLTNVLGSREGGASLWREMRRAQRRVPSESS